jgi:hypothetical protein
MDKTKFDEYLEDRYVKKIAWYNTKSILNKRIYIGFQWTVIILSACIPVLTVSIGDKYKWLTDGRDRDQYARWTTFETRHSHVSGYAASRGMLAAGSKYQKHWHYLAVYEKAREKFRLGMGN